MGYWNPPGLLAFDPTTRALDWSYSQTKAIVVGEQDLEMLECFRQRTISGVSHLSMPTVKNLGTGGTYLRMILARAPEDPEKGGLAADTVNEGGGVTINYYDFSDSNNVRRKRVTWVPKGNEAVIGNRGGVPEEWDPSAKIWKQEGPDAEREFSKIAMGLAQALGMIASAVLSAVPGGGAVAPLFSAAWSFALKTIANKGKPPSIDDVISLIGAAGKVIGPGVWGVVSKNPDIQNLFRTGFVAKMRELPGAYSDKVAAAVNEVGGILPRLNLSASVPGFSLQNWAAGQAKNLAPPMPVVPTKAGDISLADFPDERRSAWPWAWKAFLEPDPDARFRIRRNYLWCNVENSSAVTRGESTGLEAHALVEVDGGLMSAGSFFDQYLATFLASTVERIPKSEVGTIAEQTLAERRRADPEARKKLYDLVSDLRDRYEMK